MIPLPIVLQFAPSHRPSHSPSTGRAYARRLLREAARRSRTKCARLVRRRGGRDVLELWWRESSFNPRARNRRSDAMGLAGMRRRSWRNVGVAPSWNPHRQAQAFFLYVDAHPIYRGDPARALAHLRRRGYY